MPFDKGRDRAEELKAAELAEMNAPENATIASALAQLAHALQSIKASGDDTVKQLALQQADLIVRQMPENRQGPGKSSYSYPEGDLARPKPTLKYPITWVGYPLTTDTLQPHEIDWLNKMVPGTFMVTKANGNRIPFGVSAKLTLNGDVESIAVEFPCKGDQRTDHRSMVEYIRESLGEKVTTVDELMAQITALKAQLRPGRSDARS